MSRSIFRALMLAGFVASGLLPIGPAWAIVPGQVDTFEDGTTLAWTEGMNSVTPPTNDASGGPAGADDAYLRNTSTGVEAQAGSRLVCYNATQWKGNYILTGITHIRMDVANFGAAPIHVRIAIEGSSTKFSSRLADDIPADGVWRTVTFEVRDLVAIDGTATVDQALAKVTILRILSATAPEWRGDQVAGAMGIDNITAVVGGTPVAPASWGAVKAKFR